MDKHTSGQTVLVAAPAGHPDVETSTGGRPEGALSASIAPRAAGINALGLGQWAMLAVLFLLGLSIRQWVWNESGSIRFPRDINNAYYWGAKVNGVEAREGGVPAPWKDFARRFHDIYDLEHRTPSVTDMPLDYAPGRLLIMSLWARWTILRHDAAPGWSWTDAAPLLWLNMFCAALSAACGFMVGKHFAAQAESRNVRRCLLSPWWCGYVTAALIWINPALLADAHVWPQWDVWCVPFLLWSLYAASAGKWYAAGALLVGGAMFKGQMLFAAPLYILWSARIGGFKPLASLLVGALTISGVCAAFWLIPNLGAMGWTACVVCASVVSWWYARTARAHVLLAILTAFIAAGGAFLTPGVSLLPVAAVILGVCVLVWLPQARLPLRVKVPALLYISMLATIGLWGAFIIFDGSIEWARISYVNPADARLRMTIGATNLPSLLAARWHWNTEDPIASIPWRFVGATEITLRSLLRGVYVTLACFCGVLAARHVRSGNARALLAAVTAPWVAAYAVLPQMHERHLIWGALVSALGAGLSADGLGLHVLLSLLALADILRRLLPKDPSFAPRIQGFLTGSSPDMAWALLIVAAAYLWKACQPSESIVGETLPRA